MGTSWGQVVKEEGKNFPGLAEYTKCQSTVFAYSTLTMVTGNFMSWTDRLLVESAGFTHFALFQVSLGTYGILLNKRFKKVEMKHKVLSSICLGKHFYLAHNTSKNCDSLSIGQSSRCILCFLSGSNPHALLPGIVDSFGQKEEPGTNRRRSRSR